MYGLKNLLNYEEKKLIRIKQLVDSNLSQAPEGSLRITSSGKQVQYMHCTGNDKKSKTQGIYIKKENEELARKLAQKGYDQKVKRIVDRRLKQIQNLNLEYEEREIEDIYRNIHDERKKLIRAYDMPFEQRVLEWKSIPYVGKEFAKDLPEIYTKKGERVRSKSEKLIADTLNESGIEYKYECPIELRGYGTVYPDFTIMSRRTGKIVYWEHDGRMDDPKYAEKAVRKINSYIRNGIIPGEKLILTFETEKIALSDDTIYKVIECYL